MEQINETKDQPQPVTERLLPGDEQANIFLRTVGEPFNVSPSKAQFVEAAYEITKAQDARTATFFEHEITRLNKYIKDTAEHDAEIMLTAIKQEQRIKDLEEALERLQHLANSWNEVPSYYILNNTQPLLLPKESTPCDHNWQTFGPNPVMVDTITLCVKCGLIDRRALQPKESTS